MCGRIIQNKRIITPGNPIMVNINNHLIQMTFGLKGSSGYLYNARTETWKQKWEPNGWSLCKIPIDGFYEKGHQFEFVGNIRGLWKNNICVILTMDANEEVKPFHHRMPVYGEVA